MGPAQHDPGQVNANAAADAVYATEYGRPEDIELIGQTLYVANTTEDRVIAIELNKMIVRPSSGPASMSRSKTRVPDHRLQQP